MKPKCRAYLQQATFWLAEGDRAGVKLAVHPQGVIRYVVPQTVSLPADEDVRLFFRVGEVVEKAAVIVECGEKVLYKGMRPKLLPGEMESVTLKAETLSGLDGGQLTVRLEKR